MPSAMPDNLVAAFVDPLRRMIADDFQIDPTKAASDLLPALGTFWQLYADKGALSLRLQYLYTQRDALDWIRRRIFDFVTSTEDGVEQSNSDAFKNLDSMRATIGTDIVQLETQVRAGQQPMGGLMTTQRPPPFQPGDYADPTDPRFRGLPFDPRIFGGS